MNMDNRKETGKTTWRNDAKNVPKVTKDSSDRVKNLETDRNVHGRNSRPSTLKANDRFGRQNDREEKPDLHRNNGQNETVGQGRNPTKKSQAKVTNLYVVIGDKVTEIRNLKNFLLYRMGKPKDLDFTITNVSEVKKNGRKKSCITLQFESLNKANLGKHFLNKSNRNVQNKVECFLNMEEVEGEVVDTAKQRKEQIERALKETADRAQIVLEKHDAKINDVQEKLSDVEKHVSDNRGVSLFEYDKLCNEKLAFEDKLEELGKHRKEFNRYMQCMKEKLEGLLTCGKFEKELQEIRKAFGVECRRFDAALPMYARREDILTTVRENQVCVILGETGSGKSTQMVQYLYQAGYATNGLIACTQPRKIAAVSLATHVSSELASNVGQVVGYKVGMQKKMTAVTKVLFMTDHVLLNDCLLDRMLKKYSCILIDEAHERSIHTDLLLGMLKVALNNRPDLKVIITSATIDPDIFVKYFGGSDRCPVLKVSGRAFPVDVFWEHDFYDEKAYPEYYETKALNKAIEIHKSTKIDEGDILVFLTAVAEIERCTEKLKEQIGEADVQCLQLHGRLKTEEQQLVFEKTPRGKRKIVFATNSAETSITIPGIKYVVDTGVVKEMRFDPKKNMNSLNVVSVSQSSANQRKGRAGRTESGVCYRLYTEEDFKMMEKASNPEILRIQVSQALLKLMELGVDPMKFDYVQSPSLAAMQSAMVELKSIGAVTETGISKLGRWIAKFPVEPRLGVLIKKGIDLGIPTEILIVASCCNQSGIFYRVGTLEEKKAADLKKMRFCHRGGDLLTMLNVYREWDKVQEREKGSWCDSNSINGKAMKGVRDMMNEITSILKKDLGLKIKHEYKSPEEADLSIQNLIFECMSSNLGYYLGHECAGYLLVNRYQRVQIHPSSAILALGLQPSWVVFNKVLKTSADFMTEVTPVADEMVIDAIEKRKVYTDLKTLVSQRVNLALKIPVGKHVNWKFVGPMHMNRRKVEEDIGLQCGESLVVVESNKNRGEISLFCIPQYEDQASGLLRSIIEPMSQQLINESREESIGNEKSGVRAVLREGGAVVEVLMPYEYRSLKIWLKEGTHWTKPDETNIQDILGSFGPVEQIWQPIQKKQNDRQFWGKVTFTNQKDAVAAGQAINEDKNARIILEPVTFSQQNSDSQGFTMKVSWCRRPSKGHCFVSVERPEDLPLLLMSLPRLNGNRVNVSLSKRGTDLYLKPLPSDVTDDDVKKALADALSLPISSCKDRFRVVIPRMNVIGRPDERIRNQEELLTILSTYVNRESFRIHIKEYKQQTVMCTAFVTFSDPQICNDTARELMQGNWKMDGSTIQVSLECKSSVHVKKKLYEIVKEDVERLIGEYVDESSTTTIHTKTLKSGHISLEIRADTPYELAKAKVRVDRVVGGDTFGYESKKEIQVMFSKTGRQKAQEIEKETNTLIFVDDREMKVTVQGLVSKRVRAVELIEDYIRNNKAVEEMEIRLKGQGNPPGMMKAMLVKYGNTVEDLKKETNVATAQLNLRLHTITLTGNNNAIEKALDAIKETREELIKRDEAKVLGNDLPDCPVCLCPVEESDMYRLEYCAHAYCKLCLASQIQNAVSDRQLPVICAAVDCNKPLVIRDINTQIKMGTIKRKGLLAAAVACFVSKGNGFKFCITPDCDIIYRVTSDGSLFVCPMCRTKICTSCHTLYHEGLTCAMYKVARTEGDSVVSWQKEDPLHRRMCPKCGFGIEKTGGCDHVECTMCKANICWKCMAYFTLTKECYGHMNTVHQSFV